MPSQKTEIAYGNGELSESLAVKAEDMEAEPQCAEIAEGREEGAEERGAIMKWLFVLLMVSLLAIPAVAQDITGAGWMELTDTEQELYLMGLRAGVIVAANLLAEYMDMFFATIAGALHIEYSLEELAVILEAFLQKYDGNLEHPVSQLLFIVQ